MAKPNYSYEKRQRELAKKKKKEEKAARKAHGKVEGAGPGVQDAAADAETTPHPEAGVAATPPDAPAGPPGQPSA